MLLALPAFLGKLLKREKQTNFSSDAVRSLSVSRGHMDYSFCYSFYLRKGETGWLLDADFALGAGQPHIEYEARPVTETDASELLKTAREQEIASRIRRYKKPKTKVFVSDETTHYTSLGFENGETLGAAVFSGKDLESLFFRLAEKYADASSQQSRRSPDGI